MNVQLDLIAFLSLIGVWVGGIIGLLIWFYGLATTLRTEMMSRSHDANNQRQVLQAYIENELKDIREKHVRRDDHDPDVKRIDETMRIMAERFDATSRGIADNVDKMKETLSNLAISFAQSGVKIRPPNERPT